MSGFSTSGGVHSGAGAVDDSSLLSLVPPSAPSSAGGAAHLRQPVELLHLRQLVVEELRIDSCQDLVLQEGYILELELLMILHYCRWYLRLHLRQPVELLHLRQLVVEELRIDSCQDLVLQEGYILELELLMILHYCRWYLRLHLRQPVELLHLRQLVELLPPSSAGGAAAPSSAGGAAAPSSAGGAAAPSSAGGAAAPSSAGGAAAPSLAGGAAAPSSAGGAAAPSSAGC